MTVGDRIRFHRKENGLTQEALAEELDVTRQAVAKWENGKSSPSTANLMKMAELFNVSFRDLIQEREEPITREELDELRQNILGLKEEARERRAFIEGLWKVVVSSLALTGGYGAVLFSAQILLSSTAMSDYVLRWTLENHILTVLYIYALIGTIGYGRRFGGIVFAGTILGVLLGSIFGALTVKLTEMHFNDGEIALIFCSIVFSVSALAEALVRQHREMQTVRKKTVVGRVLGPTLIVCLAVFTVIGADYSAHKISFERGALAGYRAGYEQGVSDRERGLPANSRKNNRSIPENYRDGSSAYTGYMYYWPTGYHRGYKEQEAP